ncbi:MAG: hypothetical protein AABY16_03840 [Nanoarchaeota archaeon]
MNELPDLTPSAPSMRDYQRVQLPPIEPLNEEKEDIHSLPSFPDSPMKSGFSQSAIKSAVGESEHENSDEMKEWRAEPRDRPSMPRNSRAIEMEEWSPQTMPLEEMRLPPPSMQMSPSDSKRPLFVKLDKFREARDSLAKISEKLDQMDELLKMIKEVKAKEDEEINYWEHDMENIKARISLVNKEIFENAY